SISKTGTGRVEGSVWQSRSASRSSPRCASDRRRKPGPLWTTRPLVSVTPIVKRLSVASSCNSRPRISRPSSAKANANAARKAFVRSTKRLLAEITEGLTRHIDVRPVISKLTGYNRPPKNASLKRVTQADPMWNEDGKLLPEVNLSDHGD